METYISAQNLATVVSICTIGYSFITLLMYIESRKTRKLKTEPLIIAYLKSSEDSSSYSLHLKNIGEGLAKDVTVTLLKDYSRYNKIQYPLSKAGIFANGLTIFPPDYEMKFILNFWQNYNEQNKDTHIELEIEYRGIDNEKRSNTYKLNIEEIKGQFYSNPPETFIGQIAFHLNEISKELKKPIKNVEKKEIDND